MLTFIRIILKKKKKMLRYSFRDIRRKFRILIELKLIVSMRIKK